MDLAVIGFRGELRQGGIRDAVARAVERGAVRVLDVLLVRKDDDGSVQLFDAESPEGAEELLGFPTILPDLVGEEDAQAIAEEMDPGTTVLVIAWENAWASDDRRRGAGARRPAARHGTAPAGGRRDGAHCHPVAGGGVMRGRRGRPGLMGVAARTAVVAGTATAVSGKVQRGQQAKAQQAADADADRQQQTEAQAAPVAPAEPAAPDAPTSGTDDMLGALERLGALHEQGVLTDEEFAQQKARILA